MGERSFLSPVGRALRRGWRFLVRMDVAAVITVIVLLLAALGSFFPHPSPTIAADAERLARWQAEAHERFGGITGLLVEGSAYRYLRLALFVVPLALLAVVTLACILDRWPRVWRRVFHRPVRCAEEALTGAQHAASLSAPSSTPLADLVRRSLEARGFAVRSEVDGSDVFLRADRYRLAPLATLVSHLAVPLLLVGVLLSGQYGWREVLAIGPDETTPVGHGTGLAVDTDGFVISRYPDGSVSSYDAEITVIAGGDRRAGRIVRVNEPVVHSGVGFHLQGYGETADGYSITLLAVHDPGFGLVVVAGFLLLLGVAVTFNFPRCCVRARVGADGTLQLAGHGERQAYDFEREFAGLVKEISDGVKNTK